MNRGYRLLDLPLLSLGMVAGLAAAQPAMAQASPSAYTTGYRWDVMRRLVGEISPAASGTAAPFAATRYTYDPDGQLTKTEKGYLASWQGDGVAPTSWSGFTVTRMVEVLYDAAGNKLRETVSSGGTPYTVTQYAYDANDRQICTAVRMNLASLQADACALGTEGSQGKDRISKNVYDAAGQLVQVRKAVGTSLEQAYATYSYTNNGKQEYVLDANGNRAKLEYDGFDRQAKWIFPSTTLPAGYNPASQATALATAGSLNLADYEAYGYDANGNRTSLRKRDGSTIGYTFDALNRMTVKTVPERSGLAATHSRDVYYRYDLRGLMTEARFDSASGSEGILTGYDKAGRLTSSVIVMDGVGRTLGYLNDANGNRTRVTWPDSGYAQYDYDGLNRPKSVTGNASDWSRAYGYSSAGDLISDTVAGGAGTTTFGRDPIGRLSSLGRDIAGGASVDNTTSFGYNPASQITQEGRSNDAYAFTARYNVNRPYTVNGLNQYAASGSANLCYDANGNLTADGTFVYLYDIENRMVEKRSQTNATCASLSYTGGLQASLRYDPMGRLYETVGQVSGTTRFLIDGDAMVAEYDGSGTMLRRYVHGPSAGADDPIAWYEGSGMVNSAMRLLYANHQGSITLASDSVGSPGSTRLFRYDEYGIAQAGDALPLSPANGARFLYTGQAWMPDLGMYYYKARVYSPTLGRFMQTDPIGYDDQINLYAYVGNDPVNHTDPTGNAIETPWDVLNVALDVASLGANLAAGNYGGAAVDAAALIYDGAATVVPGLPGGAGAALKATRGAERVVSTARGRASEARKLGELGATRNTRAAPTSTGPRIRDGTKPDGTHVEVKDTKRVDATRQLRGLDEAAGKQGQRLEVHTGDNTRVSRNVNPDTMPNTDIVRCRTLGPGC